MSWRNKTVTIWEHDCDSCFSLGPHSDGHHDYDLYWCPTGNLGMATFVARFGNDGEQYISGGLAVIVDTNPILTEAQLRYELVRQRI